MRPLSVTSFISPGLRTLALPLIVCGSLLAAQGGLRPIDAQAAGHLQSHRPKWREHPGRIVQSVDSDDLRRAPGGGLSYSQTYDSLVGAWRESTSGMIANSGAVYPSGPDPFYTATLAGKSISFKRAGDTFTAIEGDNATLVLSGGVFTLTLTDGTVATFSTAITGAPGLAVNLGFITKIVEPSGRTVDFNYASISPSGAPTYRLQSMTSSDGYQMPSGLRRQRRSRARLVQGHQGHRAQQRRGWLGRRGADLRLHPQLAQPELQLERGEPVRRHRRLEPDHPLLLRRSADRRPPAGRVSGYDISVTYNGETQVVETATTDAGTWTLRDPGRLSLRLSQRAQPGDHRQRHHRDRSAGSHPHAGQAARS